MKQSRRQPWLTKVWAWLKTPRGLSIALHAVLILALIIGTTTTAVKIYHVSIPNTQPAIKATVIDAKAYDHQQAEIARQKARALAAKRAAERRAYERRVAKQRAIKLAKERAHKRALTKQRKALAEKRAAEKKRQLALKQKRERIEKARQRKAQQEKIKQAKAQQEKARQHKLAQEKAARERLRKQALENLVKQRLAAKRAAAAAAHQKQLLTEKEKYIGLIQQTIRANWINQFMNAGDLTVTLQIDLDSKGDVQSVTVVQSSGNAAFDRQAVIAVRKSSPLPMPKDADLAKQFQVIKLPFSNQLS